MIQVRLHATGTKGNELKEVTTLAEAYTVVDQLVEALKAKGYKINWCTKADGRVSCATMAHPTTGQCVSVDITTVKEAQSEHANQLSS